jgi:hypothetical protein
MNYLVKKKTKSTRVAGKKNQNITTVAAITSEKRINFHSTTLKNRQKNHMEKIFGGVKEAKAEK